MWLIESVKMDYPIDAKPVLWSTHTADGVLIISSKPGQNGQRILSVNHWVHEDTLEPSTAQSATS